MLLTKDTVPNFKDNSSSEDKMISSKSNCSMTDTAISISSKLKPVDRLILPTHDFELPRGSL